LGPTGSTGPSGPTGTSGNKVATVFLYQWATATPGNPSGQSTYTWNPPGNASYTGGNGWSVAVPANPGTPLIRLWVASKEVTDVATATTTTVSWTSGFTVYDSAQNGANGVSGTQAATPTVYQWAATIPTISGTSTYTWATGSFTSVPSGWSIAPTASTPGFTLWAASVRLVDSATVSTSSINWTTASIRAEGYAGTTGADGLSSRICFARVPSNPAPVTGTITTTGNSSFPSSAQSTSTWGFAATWGATDPNPSSTNSLYQSDGIYNPSTNQTSWGTPYISSLKVGSLSAVSTNTGNLTVTGTFQANTAAISGNAMTGSGGVLYPDGRFAFGNSTNYIVNNGTNVFISGFDNQAAAQFNLLTVGSFSSVGSVNISSADYSFGRLDGYFYWSSTTMGYYYEVQVQFGVKRPSQPSYASSVTILAQGAMSRNVVGGSTVVSIPVSAFLPVPYTVADVYQFSLTLVTLRMFDINGNNISSPNGFLAFSGITSYQQILV
jgi:hypothetical protein